MNLDAIQKKEGPLSMAEKLALASSGASAQVKNVKARKPTKRQVQLSKEKEGVISDKAFYDEQKADMQVPLKEIRFGVAVLSQIVQHAETERYDAVRGQLLGATHNGVLTVSSAFSMSEDHDPNYAQSKAVSQMESHATFENVGWYCSSHMDSFLNTSAIETQYKYQRFYGTQCVFLVYDATSAETKAELAVRAFRLSDQFMDLVRELTKKQSENKVSKATTQKQHEIEMKKQIELEVKYDGLPEEMPRNIDIDALVSKGLNSTNIFTEVPVQVEKNTLVETFLHQLDDEISLNDSIDNSFGALDLDSRTPIQNRLGNLYVTHDDLREEQDRYLYHLKKRKNDPERFFKSSLKMLLNRERIQNHCDMLLQDTKQSLDKLSLSKELSGE